MFNIFVDSFHDFIFFRLLRLEKKSHFFFIGEPINSRPLSTCIFFNIFLFTCHLKSKTLPGNSHNKKDCQSIDQ